MYNNDNESPDDLIARFKAFRAEQTRDRDNAIRVWLCECHYSLLNYHNKIMAVKLWR